MAEIAVSIVVDKLVPLLAQEVQLLKGVRKEVASLKDELESIQPFLRDADGKAESKDNVKVWVKQVREAAYRTEDVIDEYEFHLSERASQHRFFGFLHKIVLLIKKSKWRHELAIEIQDINGTFSKIRERRDRYAFDFLEEAAGSSSSTNKGVAWHDPRQESLFIEESESVGIEEPKCRLIKELLEGESKRTAISLLGMGGLGKTTLAQVVFNNQRVKGKFECHAWIAVSQSYDMVELLRTMIKQFYERRKELPPQGINAMDQTRLIHELREFLLQKRYLVVFDDVWEIDFWGTMEHALPKNAKSSRIVITTRKSDVASSCIESSTTHVIELQPLSQEEAWKLFCKKAFKSDLDGCCPPELEELSLDIVRKCQGLPLAIVLIGGVLSRKTKVASQWRMFHDSLRSEIENNPQLASITKILSLSYYDLPYYLKTCFLYFGIFPEDYSVRHGRLIRLWAAEGLIKEAAGKTVEEVAEDCLNELIHRSLVKVSDVFFDGRARSCLIHDMLREFILSNADELRFCHVSAEQKPSLGESIRRLSIHRSEENVSETTNFRRLRSFFLFSINKLPKPFLSTSVKNFRLLKILDFEGALNIESVPEEIGNLFHLRYLSGRNTKIRMLPKSIGKLHNLETLDMSNSLVSELPKEILGLRKPRHLLIGAVGKGVKIPEGLGSLEALQRLWCVEANQGGDGLVRGLRKLRQLRRLGISNLKRENGEALCSAIENMSHLHSLTVCSINDGGEILNLESLSSPPPLIRRLYLVGRLEKLPGWISKLQNLTRIHLEWARLLDDPLNVLRALLNLLELELWGGYVGERLHFLATGFQKLRKLDLRSMEGLKSVTIDEGALPLLQELHIGRGTPLKEGLLGEQHLRNVRINRYY